MAFLHDEQLITREITRMVLQDVYYLKMAGDVIRVISVVISCTVYRNDIYRSASNIGRVPQTSDCFFVLYFDIFSVILTMECGLYSDSCTVMQSAKVLEKSLTPLTEI